MTKSFFFQKKIGVTGQLPPRVTPTLVSDATADTIKCETYEHDSYVNVIAVASLEEGGGGRTAPRDTLQGGDTRRKKTLWANLQRIVEKRGWRGEKGVG